jgi:mannose/fructose/N-acetylgalactosamine-specific phosphotransferase system component IID
MRDWFLTVPIVLALLVGVHAAMAAAPASSAVVEEQARALERKLMAPCC